MFKFSLQRVLELKARREQTAAIELARTRIAADEARQECTVLETARAEGVRQMNSGRPTVGDMLNGGFLMQRLDDQIQHAHDAAVQAEVTAESSVGEFTLASQERRVLDRLRERHLTTWQTEQVQIDRKLMDDIALSRFTQSATTDTESE